VKLTAATAPSLAKPVLVAGGGNAGGSGEVDAAVPLGGGLEGTGEAGSLLPHAPSASAAASDAASIRGCRVVFMGAPLFIAESPGLHGPVWLGSDPGWEFVAKRVEHETSPTHCGKLATTGNGGAVNGS